MKDCLFCSIVGGGVPADVVAQTENVLAFRDINPAAPVHVLLVPKEHIADSAADLGAEHGPLLGELFGLAAEIARQEQLEDGWRLIANVGAGAGQTIFHLHFHLLGGWSRSGRAARSLADETGG